MPDGMKEMADYALRDDWSCVKGQPFMKWGKVPGLRYGASMPTRPQMVVVPCPCAGGEWSQPRKYSDAELLPDGSWKSMRSLGVVGRRDYGKSKGFAAELPLHEDEGAHNELSPARALARLASAPPQIGSEPYAQDFRCARDASPIHGVGAGKRWWYMPEYGVVQVATPCPCALGSGTRLLLAGRHVRPEAAVDDEWGVHEDTHVPSWQQTATPWVNPNDYATVYSNLLSVIIPLDVPVDRAALVVALMSAGQARFIVCMRPHRPCASARCRRATASGDAARCFL